MKELFVGAYNIAVYSISREFLSLEAENREEIEKYSKSFLSLVFEKDRVVQQGPYETELTKTENTREVIIGA